MPRKWIQGAGIRKGALHKAQYNGLGETQKGGLSIIKE